MKLSAWHDRRAPRDLYDLQALQKVGAINDEAKKLYRQLGPGALTPDLFAGYQRRRSETTRSHINAGRQSDQTKR